MDWKARFPELLGNCHIGNIVGRENPVFNCNAGGRKTITKGCQGGQLSGFQYIVVTLNKREESLCRTYTCKKVW